MLRLWKNLTGRGQAPAGSGRVSALVCAGMVLALGIAPSAQALQSDVWTAAPPAVTNVNRNGYNSGAYRWSSPLPWNVDVSKCPSNDFEFRWGAVKLALMDNAAFIAHRNRAGRCDKYDWYAEGSNAFITDSNSACSFPKGTQIIGGLRNWQNEFNNACLQHDFAFYNLGGRTGGKFPPYQGVAPYNNYREVVERHFRQNMYNRCAGVTDRSGPNSQKNCYDTAELISRSTSDFGGGASFDKSVQDRTGNLASLANATGPQFTGSPRMFDIEVRNDGTNSGTWIAQVQTNGDLLTRLVRKNSSIMEIWPQSYPGGWKFVDIEIAPSGSLWLLGVRNDGQILMRNGGGSSAYTGMWSPWFSQGWGWSTGDLAVGPSNEVWFAGVFSAGGFGYRKKVHGGTTSQGWSTLQTLMTGLVTENLQGPIDIEVAGDGRAYFTWFTPRGGNPDNMLWIMQTGPGGGDGKLWVTGLITGPWTHFQNEIRPNDPRLWITASYPGFSTVAGVWNPSNHSFSGFSLDASRNFPPASLND